MTAAYVIDSREAELGLHMCIGPNIACKRHRTYDRRATGIWEVVISLPEEIHQALGGEVIFTRPAVVDDFGSLVCVGPAQ